ncbi:hypothetical protein BN1051_02487 [Arthrobacter saudimassiliensis]|uniref:Uncharacterized protein n=1 Tax=Arthrobacter saudimassiliensis TaxID=1461584 RepID=A0A078MPE3_9MICC|nr:hypothetical protein BN1051_02487 [Arthrobacter saudimassiliensis]
MIDNTAGEPPSDSGTPADSTAPAHSSAGRPATGEAAGEAPEALDLLAALAVVQDAERSARRGLTGNTALVYLVWGLTWLLGYGALQGSRHGWLPLAPETALAVLGVTLALAAAYTVVVFARGSRGIRGQSSFQGGMYGAAWALGFAVMGALGAVIGREVEDFWTRGLLLNGTAVLIVGLLYITGGTTFNDGAQSVLGVWLLVVTLIALVAGPSHFLTVFLLLGAPGLLAAALVEHLRTRRRRGPAHA